MVELCRPPARYSAARSAISSGRVLERKGALGTIRHGDTTERVGFWPRLKTLLAILGPGSDAAAVAVGIGHRTGRVAGVLFAIALIDACIIGAAAVSLSTAYAIGDVFTFRHSLHRGPSDAKGFYAVYFGLIAASAALVLAPGTPLGLLTNAVLWRSCRWSAGLGRDGSHRLSVAIMRSILPSKMRQILSQERSDLSEQTRALLPSAQSGTRRQLPRSADSQHAVPAAVDLIAGVFEFDVDEAGNTTTQIWEWK